MSDEPIYLNKSDALVTAAYEGDFELVKQLVAKGVDVNVTNEEGETAIIVAAQHGYSATIEFLLSHGANVNAKDNDGDTALDVAKYYDCEDTVELLQSAGSEGADGPSAKERGMDAYYEACRDANAVKGLTRLMDNDKP